MNLCDSGHDEVCYDGRTCPVCSVKEELSDEIKELTDRVKELELELEDRIEME